MLRRISHSIQTALFHFWDQPEMLSHHNGRLFYLFATAFVCLDCDMCCNALEECNVPLRQRFPPWLSTMILLICCFAGLCVVWWIIRILTTKRILSEPGYSAFESAGEESVYFFFLADSKVGWLVTVATLFVQIAIFGLFLSAASFDNGDGDFVYSWRCPLNTPECNDERAVTAYGWVMVSTKCRTMLCSFVRRVLLLNSDPAANVLAN